METPSPEMADLVELVDLESTPEYQALVVAAAGKPERAMGDSVIPAEPPQWSDVLSRAEKLLHDPAHLSVLVYLVKASCYVNGFHGLNLSLLRIAECLESQWDVIQPAADPDDKDDPHYARVNIIRELPDDPTFTNMIYRLPLVDVRGVGAFSARDIDIAKGVVSGTEEELEHCRENLIRGAMQETGAEALGELSAALQSIQDCCTRIDAMFDQHAGDYHGLSMKNLAQRTSSCQSLLLEMADEVLASQAVEARAELGDAAPVSAEAAVLNENNASQAPATSSSLLSRQDVASALDSITAYYRNHEPSSPVPILAARAREMVPKSFFQIIQELAPDSGDSFAACMENLSHQPMAFLLADSYQRFIADGGRSEAQPTTEAAADVAAAEQGANLSHSGSQSGTPLDSRSEVIDVLNDIDLFFRQTEPASPIPLIVAEMKKMVAKNFSQLVADFCQSLGVNAAATPEAEAE